MLTLFVTSIFLILIAFVSAAGVVGILVYDRVKDSKLSTISNDDWLFGDFQGWIYHLVYPKPITGESVCGINIKDYDRYCKILHRENDIENIAAFRLEGVLIFFVCTIASLVLMNNVIVATVFIVIGAGAFYAMWELPLNNIKSRAEDRLYKIQNDLPRFLSLMEKAMDLPIDQAMLVTAQKFDSPLADDIIDSINKVSLGAGGWQTTLYDLAKIYDIEAFSDMVLEIINAYDQGVNIRDTVNRKIKELEEDRLLATQDHDSRIKTLIFLPIIALKIVPLMVLICLPMLTMYF